MRHRTENRNRGFSLMELLIVIAIIAILGVAGFETYRSFSKDVELRSVSRSIAADLRHMQSKSMTGEGGQRWGVHFVSGDITYGDHYTLFSTTGSATTTIATTTLSKGVTFSDPSSGTKDIIFGKISGTTTVSAVSIVSEGMTQTINVTAIGTIN